MKGLFGLNKTETIYYRILQDSKGNPLDGRHCYRIEGSALDSRWWSITTYDKDRYLIPNENNKFSFTADDFKNYKKDHYTIYVSPSKKGEFWLPTGNQREFSVILRLYNPSASIYNNLDTCELPIMIKESSK